MTGVDRATKGGMWTVASNYLESPVYRESVNVDYVATATRYEASVFSKAVRSFTSIMKIGKSLRKERFDLVHIHMSERGSYFRAEAISRIAHRMGVPVVIHMHGGSFDSFYNGASDRLQRRIRSTLNGAGRVITLGGKFADECRGIGVDPSRVVILPNAVSIPSINNYNPDAADVTYLGRISIDKGVLEYLDAIAQLDGEVVYGRRFMLFGPECGLDAEREMASRSLSGRAFYGGFLDAIDKELQFDRSCMLVLPSRFEVFPMCVLEAMAHGVPVVSTEVGSVSDVIENGENGILVKPRSAGALCDAMGRLLGDRELRLKMSRMAYKTVKEHYSLETHIKKLIEIYREVMTDYN